MEDRLKVRLDLWQLEVFCAVAEQGSFSRAADALFVSQPTVTTHIAALEKRLGVKLFDRTTRRVTLTPAGKLLYRHAKALLAEHEAAVQELNQFQGGLMGRLVFGASTIPGQYLLPEVMAQFCHQYPQTKLSMRIGSSQQVLDDILSGSLEMGIIGFPPDEPSLQVIPLWDDEVVMIVSPLHPWASRPYVSIDELPTQPFVFREEGSGTRRTFEQFLSQHGLSPRQLQVTAEVGGTEAVKRFVMASGSVGVVSICAIEREHAAHQLTPVRLREGHILRQFFAILPNDRTVSPLCHRFVQFLQEQIASYKTNRTLA